MNKALTISGLVVVTLSLVLTLGCGQPSGTSSKKTSKKSKVTPGDVVDYGIGKTPLEIKKKKTDALKAIERQQQRKLDDALK